MNNYQAIYQIKHDSGWLDYGRHSVHHPDDAMADVRILEHKEGKKFRGPCGELERQVA